jgi:uncharacterized membrane protein YkoI
MDFRGPRRTASRGARRDIRAIITKTYSVGRIQAMLSRSWFGLSAKPSLRGGRKETPLLRTKLMTAILAGTLASGAIGGSVAAYAKNRDAPTDEAAVMANAKVSMAEAMATAEQAVGGKAVGSGIEDQDGTVYLEVQVLKGGTRHKVLIDPQSGKVVKTVTADNEQNENGHEGDDD